MIKYTTIQYKEKTNIIPSKMIVKEKFLANGEPDKVKARLTAGGHREKMAQDYDVCSPMVDMVTVFTVMAIAAKRKMKVMTLDVKGAYLLAQLPKDRRILMAINKEYTDMLAKLDKSYKQYVNDKGQVVIELKKRLYGLKEAGLLWNQHLSKMLTDAGYKQSKYDSCLYYKSNGGKDIYIYITVHVDDMI